MLQSPKILLFQEYFCPGYLAGGMQTASKHFLSNPNTYNIRIITSNVDLNDTTEYTGIFPDRWTNRKFGDRFFPVWYGKKGFISLKNYIHFYSFKPDWIYLQGIYGYYFFLLPLLLALFYRTPVIICPHGMLDKGSLKQKSFKKWIYIKVFAGLGLHKKIRWQATSAHEWNQIKYVFGRESIIFRTQLIVSHSKENIPDVRKDEGVLHLLFYSRVTPKKNLHLILESIFNSQFRIFLSIVGPLEDKMYWENKCIPWMNLLGNRVCYKGSVTSLDVYPGLKEIHFMILPSEAENFSFSIFECLSRGIPVIISRNTPWVNIEKENGGFVLDHLSFITTLLNKLIHLNDKNYQLYREGALKCAMSYMENNQVDMAYHHLFSCTQ